MPHYEPGLEDPNTVAALQARLARHRPIDPSDPETLNAAPLATREDGQVGPQTIAHLQVFLGTDPTGELSQGDVQALQAHLGVETTGDLDPATVAALRAALDADTF